MFWSVEGCRRQRWRGIKFLTFSGTLGYGLGNRGEVTKLSVPWVDSFHEDEKDSLGEETDST